MTTLLRRIRHLRRADVAALAVRCAGIVAVACTLGLAGNSVHPMGLPLLLTEVRHPGIPRWVWQRVERVTPQEARRRLEVGGVVLLDVRDRADYEAGHIPGALSLPFHEFSTAYPPLRASLPPDKPLLIYCYGSDCGLAMRVAKRLLPMGYQRLSTLTGGIAGWEEAGLKVTSRPKEDRPR